MTRPLQRCDLRMSKWQFTIVSLFGESSLYSDQQACACPNRYRQRIHNCNSYVPFPLPSPDCHNWSVLISSLDSYTQTREEPLYNQWNCCGDRKRLNQLQYCFAAMSVANLSRRAVRKLPQEMHRLSQI